MNIENKNMIHASGNLKTILATGDLKNIKVEDVTEFFSIIKQNKEVVGVSFLGHPKDYKEIKDCYYSRITDPGIYYDHVHDKLYYFKTREAYEVIIPVTRELIVFYKTNVNKNNEDNFVGLCLFMS